MLDEVRRFLVRHVPPESRVVVAFSGGPDSTALATALALLEEEGVIGGLVLAHVNHLLRGAESDADEAFAHSFATRQFQTHRLQFQSCRIDVAAAAKASGDNLENTARRLRYEWLTHVARESDAAWVATGHTANDQAETVLHRLLRGSGLQGLCGIRARRRLADGVELVRPLLQVTRAQVVAFLAEHELETRQDSSNLSLDFTRNRIRQALLPCLAEDYNPAVAAALARLAEQASDVQDIINEQADVLLRQAELPRAGVLIVLRGDALRDVHIHLAREVFRRLWQREGWPAARMSFTDWQRLADLAAPHDRVMDLPGGVTARRRGAVIQLEYHPH